MSDQFTKDDEYYSLLYVQNVQFLWRKNYWMAGVIVYIPLTLFFVKLSLLTILFVLFPIFVGIFLGRYTAESLHNTVEKYPERYAEAGRRYADYIDMVSRSKSIRFRYSEPQLFWKTGLWSDSLLRLAVLGSTSLIAWYVLTFHLEGFKYFSSGFAVILLPYLAYACHWLSALWWWKHKVVRPQRYKELYRF